MFYNAFFNHVLNNYLTFGKNGLPRRQYNKKINMCDSVAPFYLMPALLSCFLLQFLFLIDMSCKIRGVDLYNLWVDEKKGKLWEIAFLYLLVFKSFWVSTSFLRVCVCARVRVWCVCACAHACMFDLSSEEQMQESLGTLLLGRLDIVTA